MASNDGNKSSLSLSPSGGDDSSDEDSTGDTSQIRPLHDTHNTNVDAPTHGYATATEQPETTNTDSTRSKEVKSVCQRSVKFNRLGMFAPAPSDLKAVVARQSMPRNTTVKNYDKRRKEMVQDVIYKQGGHVIDRKDKQMKKVEPGTPLPPPPLPNKGAAPCRPPKKQDATEPKATEQTNPANPQNTDKE